MIIKVVTPQDLGNGLAVVANKVVPVLDGTSIQLNGSNQISTVISPTVINDLVTLSGLPANSTTLGTFTGSIIPDSVTTKAAIQALETAIESQNIAGQFAGSAATFAALPTTTADTKPVNNSDWAILTADDGANQAGIYVFNGTAYTLAKEIPEVFTLVVSTSNTTSVSFTGNGTVGSPLAATVILDPVAGNIAKNTGAGVKVIPADVKAVLIHDNELQDLSGNSLGFISSVSTFV